MRPCLSVVVLCSAWVCVPGLAYGKQVCGQEIVLHTKFKDIKTHSAKPRAAYEALGQALSARAPQWSEAVRERVTGAFRDMVTDQFAPADFKIDDVGADVIQTQVAFPATRYQFELPKTADDPICRDPLEKATRQEAAEFVGLVAGALGQLSADKMKAVATQIVALEKIYDKYLFEGFPLFPWEAGVNSCLLTDKSIANGPPRNAIVFLHPSVGVVSSVGSDTQSDLGNVLAIEPLGWIKYSADYDTWYGVSLLAVFPSDREVGYGIALNYRNFKLGVTYHDDDTGKYDGAAIFFGMDLYQFLGEKQRSYSGYLKKVKQLMDEPQSGAAP
jgi:hypothetical protein